MITTNKNWEKRGKNHKSTNDVMSNDGLSIEIIDRSHGEKTQDTSISDKTALKA